MYKVFNLDKLFDELLHHVRHSLAHEDFWTDQAIAFVAALSVPEIQALHGQVSSRIDSMLTGKERDQAIFSWGQLLGYDYCACKRKSEKAPT